MAGNPPGAGTITFMVSGGGDTVRPVALLDDDDVVTVHDLRTLTGTVSDDSGTVGYRLECREKGATQWTTFAENFDLCKRPFRGRAFMRYSTSPQRFPSDGLPSKSLRLALISETYGDHPE